MSVVWPVAPLECDIPATDVPQFTAMATQWLAQWTGFGVYESTVYPNPVTVRGVGYWNEPLWGYHSHPLPGRDMVALGCGMCDTTCACANPGVKLPGRVLSVQSVTLSGTTLDPTEYRLTHDGILLRIDQPWPVCLNEPDEWSITYLHGLPVPMGGQVAASVLACEMWKAATNSAKCRLPTGLQSVTRQGVSMQTSARPDVPTGSTGIWLIDSWVAEVTRTPATVKSPDYNFRSRT